MTALDEVAGLAAADIRLRRLQKPELRLAGLASIARLLAVAQPSLRENPRELASIDLSDLTRRLAEIKGLRLNGAETSALNILVRHAKAWPGKTGTASGSWRSEVLKALRRIVVRRGTVVVTRRRLIEEELPRIVKDAGSTGATPSQTLSRVLQELRDEGLVLFLANGKYLFLEHPVSAENVDIPDPDLDIAVRHNKLRFGTIPTSDIQAVARQRRGQDRVRALTLENYSHRCALCDIEDPYLLVASHVSTWSDDPDNRGNLSNVICLCRFHDSLFEAGYIEISDNLEVLRPRKSESALLGSLLAATLPFRLPKAYPPDREFLRRHRERSALHASDKG